MINKNYKLFSLIVLVLALALAKTANANPLFLAPTAETATSTTSVSYLTPGVATSTITYDAYTPSTNFNFYQYVPTKSALLLRFVGSSTLSTLAINFEYSNDGIDWYKSLLVDSNAQGTTSPVIDLSATYSYRWQFASSTVGGVAQTASNSATSTRVMLVPTPTRFVRMITSITGGNGSFWGQFAPIKEAR